VILKVNRENLLRKHCAVAYRVNKNRMWPHAVEQTTTHNPATTTRNLLLSFAQENYCKKLLFWISHFADHIHYAPSKKMPCCAENTQYPSNELLLVC